MLIYCHYTSRASVATVVRLIDTAEYHDVVGNVGIWMDLEFAINILCTAMSTLKPLLKRSGILSSHSPSDFSVSNQLHRNLGIQVNEEVVMWTNSIEDISTSEARCSNSSQSSP